MTEGKITAVRKTGKISSNVYDYVIVGGGIAGCVLASRLKQGNPSLSIVIIEAGPEACKRPNVLDGSQWHHYLQQSST